MLLKSWLLALVALASAAVPMWIASVVRRNVTIVDTLWPLFFIIAAVVYAHRCHPPARARRS